MSPRARRIVIPIIVLAIALFVVLARFLAPSAGPAAPSQTQTSSTSPSASTPAANAGETEVAQATPESTETADDSTPTTDQDGAEREPSTGDAAADVEDPDAPPALPPLQGLTAVAPEPGETTPPLLPLGSFDWRMDRMKVEFAADGAGIERITFSDIWQTAAARRQADDIKQRIIANQATLDELPAEQRYVLQRPQRVVDYKPDPPREYSIPPFAARSVTIDGVDVALFGEVWSQTAPGQFVTEIRDDRQQPVLRIHRAYELRADGYDITLRQRIENLTERALSVQLVHYGPYELEQDRSIVETRRLRFGYLMNQQRDPAQTHVLAHDGDLLLPHGDVVDAIQDMAQKKQRPELWPNRASSSNGYRLSWFAWNNRYFAIAAYPAQPSPDSVSDFTLDDTFERIQGVVEPGQDVVITSLFSVPISIAPGSSASVDLGIYAGPLDAAVLDDVEPYRSLNLSALILYQMAGCCSFCTFQWLAHGLLWFLATIHHAVFDWAVAIIMLVIVVRILLHPITKKSQVNMMRFSKQMQAMQPELKKIQEKYKGDAKRLQQEQMKLWRERGVNPVTGALGCLPMFLQMPIWIALYAMLYFAFELRHQPAFWGVFQAIAPAWTFLSDLSAPDQFLPLGALSFTVPLLGFHVDSINVLPLLLGVVFFIQQKYMTPPPSPTMTPEQIQQQKIMKVMMVVLFPLMMYTVPSGLTLYIVTSTVVGILESRYVRRHIDQLDLEGSTKPAGTTPKKPRDPIARAYAAAMERAREKAEARRQGPPKSFKKRR